MGPDPSHIITLNRHDREAFELGVREGLNEGITVPYMILGECPGSCTFAGMRYPEKAERLIGLVQMIGIFAFQAARRLVGNATISTVPVRLQPRLRDCIVLAGRGLSNKEIARALGITPRTVDGYLTDALTAQRVLSSMLRHTVILSAQNFSTSSNRARKNIV